MASKKKSNIRNYRSLRWLVPAEKSRLSHAQFLQITYGFAVDETATFTAQQSGVSQKTTIGMYRRLRRRLVALRGRYDLGGEVDMEELWAFHEDRQSRFPGWRKDELDLHFLESDLRYRVREFGPFWIYAALLKSLYQEPLSAGIE